MTQEEQENEKDQDLTNKIEEEKDETSTLPVELSEKEARTINKVLKTHQRDTNYVLASQEQFLYGIQNKLNDLINRINKQKDPYNCSEQGHDMGAINYFESNSSEIDRLQRGCNYCSRVQTRQIGDDDWKTFDDYREYKEHVQNK